MPDEQEINEYLTQMESELKKSREENRQLAQSQLSLYGNSGEDNLVKWQLDLESELDKIYHLLQGHRLSVINDKGDVGYVEPEDCDLKPFNEFGTQIIMNIIQFYLTRNTILSNYDNETINWKILDFGVRLSDLLHNRYEEMMMTTSFEEEFKKSFPAYELFKDKSNNMRYKFNGQTFDLTQNMIYSVEKRLNEHLLGKMKMCDVICGAIVDSVHSAYLRALKGGERGSLRTIMSVTQNDSPLKNMGYPVVGSSQKQGIFSKIKNLA